MRKYFVLVALILLASNTRTAEMAGDGLKPDATPAPVTTTGPSEYIVKRGDTLWDIARTHDITVADLMAANGLDAQNVLAVGQRLTIPSADGAAVAPTPSPAIRYAVKAGDTLWGIAVAYGTTTMAITARNRLNRNGVLSVGQVLVLPPGSQLRATPTPQPVLAATTTGSGTDEPDGGNGPVTDAAAANPVQTSAPITVTTAITSSDNVANGDTITTVTLFRMPPP